MSHDIALYSWGFRASRDTRSLSDIRPVFIKKKGDCSEKLPSILLQTAISTKGIQYFGKEDKTIMSPNGSEDYVLRIFRRNNWNRSGYYAPTSAEKVVTMEGK